MDYENASDFEINKAVAELQPYTTIVGEGKYPSISEDAVHVEQRAFKYGNINEFGVDYCKNPSDAWQIIVDNNISLCLHSDDKKEWFAFNGFFSVNDMAYSYEHKSENPLRAACIVYLMMHESVL